MGQEGEETQIILNILPFSVSVLAVVANKVELPSGIRIRHECIEHDD